MTSAPETVAGLQRRLAAARAAATPARVWGLRVNTDHRRWWVPVSVIREVLPPARIERWPSQPAGAWGVRDHRGQAMTVWPWTATAPDRAWILWPRGTAWDARGLAFDGPGVLSPRPTDHPHQQDWHDDDGVRVDVWVPDTGIPSPEGEAMPA